jgi:hypothetical protein
VERGFVFVSTNYRLLPNAGIKEMAGDVARSSYRRSPGMAYDVCITSSDNGVCDRAGKMPYALMRGGCRSGC